MALNQRKLREWVSRRTLTPPLASRFAVFHIARNGDSLIASIDAAGCNDDIAAHVERVVTDETADHVDAWPGRQQYVVRAYADGNEESCSEYAFALAARAGIGGEAVATLAAHTPDHEAAMVGQIPLQDFSHPHAMVMGQQMRHNEALLRYVVDLSMSSRERDGAIIARQQRHIDKLEEHRFGLLESIEEMYSRKQERDLVQRRWESDEARKEKLLKRVTGLVLPEMARKAGIPMEDDVIGEIRQMFLGLPVEVQSAIAESLGDEKGHRLMDLFAGANNDSETKH